MGTSDLVNLPTTARELTELTCRLAAALASEADPSAGTTGPLNVATSAMAAKVERILCMETPFSACFSSKRCSFHLSPANAGNVLAIEWAHRDLLTKISVQGI